MKRLVRGEKGYVLIAALLVLLVLGLISGPLLSYMVSGLRAGRVFETGAAELYAADAGVEDAVLGIPNLGLCVGQSTNYPIPDVNGKSIDVTVTLTNNVTGILTYKITSTAVTDGGGNTAGLGSSTQIEAYVTGMPVDYSSITDYILCSQGEIEWGNKVTLNYTEGHGPEDYYAGSWPTPEELKDFYWQDVKNVTPYPSGIIDIAGVNTTKGPLYRNGTLDILNSENTPATFVLNGTLYITGDTLIGQNGKDTLTLDLNGQTIFVESSSADAIIVGGKCTVKGPGAIIAVGDVYFAPKGDVGGNEEPVFILSVSGTTKLQPSGDFYGAIAGSIWVDVQQGKTPKIVYPPGGFEDDDLNFPGFGDIKLLVYSIASWEISRQ